MKKILLFLALLAFLATPAFASVGLQYNRTPIGTVTDINIPSGASYNWDGSTFTLPAAGSVAAITSGTIDGAVIGGVTPAAGSFTTLSASSTLGVTGNFAVNTNKFSVTASSGNTSVAGTLGVTGVSTLAGVLGTSYDAATSTGLTIGGSNATSLTLTPNTTVSGTLAVTGAQTSTGAIYANGGVDRSTAAVLTLGGANATGVTITPATTVTGALYANGGLDRSTAAGLAIGASNANAVTVTPPTTFSSTVAGPGTGFGIYALRVRVPIASVNSGYTLIAAVTGRKIHVIDAQTIAYGGAVTSTNATGFAIKGTQSSSVVQLFTVAKAQAVESFDNRFGSPSTILLADGAGLIACDTATAITIAAVGGTDLAGATGIDVILTYSIE
jgi:hypothetical protein